MGTYGTAAQFAILIKISPFSQFPAGTKLRMARRQRCFSEIGVCERAKGERPNIRASHGSSVVSLRDYASSPRAHEKYFDFLKSTKKKERRKMHNVAIFLFAARIVWFGETDGRGD